MKRSINLLLALVISPALVKSQQPALGPANENSMPGFSVAPNGGLEIKPSPTSSADDFDFLVGDWEVTNHKLKATLVNCTKWMDFPATSNMFKILRGIGNTDNFITALNGEPFEGRTLRLFNPETKLWSIYWAASNSGVLDAPVVGSFNGNIGYFYGRNISKGRNIIEKFRWDKTDPDHPVWSQAFSTDEGKTWEWNWYMFNKRPGTVQVKNREEQRIKVMELRNYELRPGKRDEFLQLFNSNFTLSQENLGGYVLGKFEVKGSPDRFYWMRGFEDMEARSKYLPAFYYNSKAWKANRAEANSMIVDNDSVLLVRPLNNAQNTTTPNTGISRKAFDLTGDVVVAEYYWAKDNELDNLIGFFQTAYRPYLQSRKLGDVSLWVSEMAENDFPKLPVIQNKNLLVAINSYKNEAAYQSAQKNIETHFAGNNELRKYLARKETIILYSQE